MTGEAPDVRSDKRKPGWTSFEHQSASISINQHNPASISIYHHQWALICFNQNKSATISFNQHRSAPITISQHQSASDSINQHVNRHQSTCLIELATICTGINAPNFWGARGDYRKILRSVRRLCEKVVRGRLQELLSELTNIISCLAFIFTRFGNKVLQLDWLKVQKQIKTSKRSFGAACLSVSP